MNRKRCKIKNRHILPVLLVLFSTTAFSNWMLLPVAGYSSFAGIVYGIRIKSREEIGFDSGFLQLVHSTEGMERIVLSFSTSALDGDFSSIVEHLKLPGISFYGYGNGGDSDSTTVFTGESQRLRLLYSRRMFAPLTLGLGIETRHSTVYDREESPLWSTLPGEHYNSVWTVGPVVHVRLEPALVSSLTGYTELDMDWQTGDDINYSIFTGQSALFYPVPVINTTAACRVMLKRHIGTGTTPFMWLSFLGGSDDLRGYRKNRFAGEWLLVSNLELRQNIFSFSSDNSSFLQGIEIALFGDAGQVSDSFDSMRWNRFHLSGGAGIRIHLSGDRTIRLDIARSPEGMGGSMSFGEMF